MRAFIAVNLDQNMRTEIERIQLEMASKVKGIRWVKSELLHITLKFLGEVDRVVIPALSDAMNVITQKNAPFTISFSRIGVFPRLKKPRVIWIGVEKGVEELSHLAVHVDQSIENIFDVKEEESGQKRKQSKEAFKPHLTIGRAKKNETVHMSQDTLAGEWRCAGTLNVDAFFLMESNLTSSGPIYRPVRKFLLK